MNKFKAAWPVVAGTFFGGLAGSVVHWTVNPGVPNEVLLAGGVFLGGILGGVAMKAMGKKA